METYNHALELGLIFLKFIYYIKWYIDSCNVYGSTNDILPELERTNATFTWDQKRSQNSQKEILWKGDGSIIIADVKTYYKAIIIKIA